MAALWPSAVQMKHHGPAAAMEGSTARRCPGSGVELLNVTSALGRFSPDSRLILLVKALSTDVLLHKCFVLMAAMLQS